MGGVTVLSDVRLSDQAMNATGWTAAQGDLAITIRIELPRRVLSPIRPHDSDAPVIDNLNRKARAEYSQIIVLVVPTKAKCACIGP